MKLLLVALVVRFVIAYVVDKRAAKKEKAEAKTPKVMHPAAFDMR